MFPYKSQKNLLKHLLTKNRRAPDCMVHTLTLNHSTYYLRVFLTNKVNWLWRYLLEYLFIMDTSVEVKTNMAPKLADFRPSDNYNLWCMF